MKKNIYKGLLFLYFIALFPISLMAQLPVGFQAVTVGNNWDFPMGVTFDANNTMYVWERAGKLFKYSNHTKTLLLDISDEVATYGDFGLLSVALDPNFSTNGHIYLYYIVDRHHLLHYQTSNYSPYMDEQGATIGRLTRYTINTSNFNQILPNSRKILIGETKSNGFPIVGTYHGGGDIKFSVDGSLLLACGDGILGGDYETQAYNDGILSNYEYQVGGRWRCQIPESLNGKIVRIDAETGNGISSNPYYQSDNPNSNASKVWALGLRNPFRITFKPNTGSHSQSAGNPGTLYLGDVGQDLKEEINVVTEGGQNFGWPRFEGLNHVYLNNPAYHPTVHTGPAIEYGRTTDVARVKINNTIQNVGSNAFPYTNFTGGCAIGGVFYEGSKYPEEYQNAYFMAEFNDQWVKAFKFDDFNNPMTQIDFSPKIVGLIQFAYNPNDESIYYVSFIEGVVKLNYNPQGNQAPKAMFSVDKNYGNSPLTIKFNAFDSYDPENDHLTYSWNFGDGNTATGVSPTHTYQNSTATSYTVNLTITDNKGASSTSSQKITINNTPPNIIKTSLDLIDKYNPETEGLIQLNAEISDTENHSFTYKWEAYLYHNDHRHLEYTSHQAATTFLANGIPCDNILYFYRIYLTVTDQLGASSIYFKDLYRNCEVSDLQAPSDFDIKVEGINDNSFKVSWSPSTDNQSIKFYEININGNPYSYEESHKTSTIYSQNHDILQQDFAVQVIARDFAGNQKKSSIIHFQLDEICSSTNESKIYLSDLQEVSAANAVGPIEKNRSNGEYGSQDGNTITLNKVKFKRGIGVHAYSKIEYDLTNKNYQRFKASVGLDDEVDNSACGSVIFNVYKDHSLVIQSPKMEKNSANFDININLSEASILSLEVVDANDGNCGDHASWANAHFTTSCTFDQFAPSTPINLTLNKSQNSTNLSWAYSSDNLTNNLTYEIFVNQVLIGTTNQNNYILPKLKSVNNLIKVQAKDSNSNRSVSKTLQVEGCPEHLQIQNAMVNQTTIFEAEKTIKSQYKISGNAKVHLNAGNFILLEPGFEVQNGASFSTQLSGCY